MYAVLILAASSALFLQSSPRGPTVPGYDRQPTPHAYFVLQSADIALPSFPVALWPHTLIVCNSSIGPALGRAKELLPAATLLAYRNFSDIEVANSRSGAFWDSLETVFDTTFCIRDLDDGGRCVRMGLPEDTIPTWIPFTASIDAFMQHFVTNVLPKDFHGVYVDEYTDPYPQWRRNLLPANFDIDGDDVADTEAKLDSVRAAGRTELAERLRDAIGPGLVLIGNTAGAQTPPGLFNGITIERVGVSMSFQQTLAALDAQRAISVRPHTNVVWMTEVAEEDSTALVVASRPGVWLGTTIPIPRY